MANGANKQVHSADGQLWVISALVVLIVVALVAWGWSDNWTYWGPTADHHANNRPVATRTIEQGPAGATNGPPQRIQGAASRAPAKPTS